MKTTCVASILLMLSLAGLSAAAVSDDTLKNAAILLPGDGGAGLADLVTAMTRAATTQGKKAEKRPWKCCDEALCTRSIPPICQCVDRVDRCSKACKQCEETEGSRHTCADWYHGFPGPKCKKDGGFAVPGVTLAEATAGKIDEETRPWECCDAQACALHWPTSCLCFDEFARCPDACQSCEEVKGSGRYRCNDVLRGTPAPPCSRRGGGMPRAVRRGSYGY